MRYDGYWVISAARNSARRVCRGREGEYVLFLDEEMLDLRTERLVIRRFTMEDLEDFHQVLTGDQDWWDDCSLEGARDALAFRIRQTAYHNPPLGYRAVILQDEDQLIGTVGYECYFLDAEERAWPGVFGMIEQGDFHQHRRKLDG